jgi:hypothetical protein
MGAAKQEADVANQVKSSFSRGCPMKSERRSTHHRHGLSDQKNGRNLTQKMYLDKITRRHIPCWALSTISWIFKDRGGKVELETISFNWISDSGSDQHRFVQVEERALNSG